MNQTPYRAYTEQNKPIDFVPTITGAGCCIIVENRVLLLQRSATHRIQPGTWGIPAGKIELGEEPLQAALRETHEEAGIELFPTAVQYCGHFYVSVGGAYAAHILFYVHKVHLTAYPTVILEPNQVSFCWATHEEALQLPGFTGTREALALGMKEL